MNVLSGLGKYPQISSRRLIRLLSLMERPCIPEQCSVLYTFVARAAETSVTELIALKITIHKFFAYLCHRFHKNVMIFFQIFIQIFRITFLLAALSIYFLPPVLQHLHSPTNFPSFGSGNEEALIFCRKALSALPTTLIADIIHIHICLQRTYAEACISHTDSMLSVFPPDPRLAGNSNDGCICCADCFFYLSQNQNSQECQEH